MTRALVVGSLHMDLIATAASLPTPGASIVGDAFRMSPGGKAANQAVQLARLGVPVSLLARVGSDRFGDDLRAAVMGAGVDVSLVSVDPSRHSGASTVLSAGHDYLSIIVPGASSVIGEHELRAAEGTWEVVLCQLELPVTVAATTARVAAEWDIPLVLNASPLTGWPSRYLDGLLRSADTLVVNSAEAERLTGRPSGSAEAAEAAAVAMQGMFGVPTVVVTLGAGGALCRHADGIDYHPAWPVPVADTVGAGDAFLGAWVASRLDGRSVALSLERATAAGAMAAAGQGAWGGMPTAEELDAFVERGPVYRDLSRGSRPRG